MKVAIIGGGAAGFFSAIAVRENYPSAEVTIFEKSNKLLAKVKVSGGGRCNVTNACDSIDELCKAYPRGGKSLKKLFLRFNNKDTIKWFESRGVSLKTQEDQCVFPKSNDSQSIIDCLMSETKRLNIAIKTSSSVLTIQRLENQLILSFLHEENQFFDKVIVATGGSPKRSGMEWLEKLNHEIENPVPSLFTFNMPQESITSLMGISVPKTMVSIRGTKLKSTGALLVTHWGMSGPAILKLSAFGARILSDLNYQFTLQVNWVNQQNNELVVKEIQQIIENNPQKQLTSIRPYGLPTRLWEYLLLRIQFAQDKKWNQLGNKGLNKLVNLLTNDEYLVSGKTTFKEEFVTCGGVSLESIDLKTMQSNACQNLYYAGEVVDIDAITGGYNFQGAWTTGFIAGKLE